MAGIFGNDAGTNTAASNAAFKKGLSKVYTWYTGGFLVFVVVLAILEQMGCTVFAYLRDQRIARGGTLLRETEIDVQGIALLVGFQNAGNFATAFRERNGMTPSAYRKLYTTGARH